MIRLLLIALAILFVVMTALALIATAVLCLAVACAIGIPIWLLSRSWLRRHGFLAAGHHPLDRVKNLYVEGKIDLFEFERRIAHLIAVEH